MKIDTQCAAVPPRLPSLAPLRPHQVHPPGAVAIFVCLVVSAFSIFSKDKSVQAQYLYKLARHVVRAK